MDTSTPIYLKKTTINLTMDDVPSLNRTEQLGISQYVEMVRFLEEIVQLYDIYRMNLQLLRHYYKLNMNDTFEKQFSYNFGVSDRTAINALTANLLSAGKTLINSLDAFVKMMCGEGSDVYSSLRVKMSEEYDTCFSYRFLIRLRDFAQHGHPAVSLRLTEKGSVFCYDLEQIKDTPHFDHNATMKNEYEKLVELIFKECGDNAKVSYTRTTAEFNLSILKIYSAFWDYVNPVVDATINTMEKIITARPDIIHKSSDFLNGMVIYDCIEGHAQCFSPSEQFSNAFESYKESAKKFLNSESVNPILTAPLVKVSDLPAKE